MTPEKTTRPYNLHIVSNHMASDSKNVTFSNIVNRNFAIPEMGFLCSQNSINVLAIVQQKFTHIRFDP